MTATETRSLTCPVCNPSAALVQVDRNSVLIDACPNCRGVWLDRGELDKLITLEATANEDFIAEMQGSASSESSRRSSHSESSERGGHHGGGGHGKRGDARGRKKRGGVLGDLFDW